MHLSAITLLLATACAQQLIMLVPDSLSTLPSSTTAILRTRGQALKAPLTTANTFVFDNPKPGLWQLSIACRDYDFFPYGVNVSQQGVVHIHKTTVGSIPMEPAILLEESPFELQVKGPRIYLEERAGFSPLSLLKNPIILIGVVGLGFALGVPYLLENMDPEMRAEFEQQQKKGIFGTGSGGAAPNPLQKFDMAAWMAGSSSPDGPSKASGRDTGKDSRAIERSSAAGRST